MVYVVRERFRRRRKAPVAQQSATMIKGQPIKRIRAKFEAGVFMSRLNGVKSKFQASQFEKVKYFARGDFEAYNDLNCCALAFSNS